jgi:hypothetical protein
LGLLPKDKIEDVFCHLCEFEAPDYDQMPKFLDFITLTYIDEPLFRIDLWNHCDDKETKDLIMTRKDTTCGSTLGFKHILTYGDLSVNLKLKNLPLTWSILELTTAHIRKKIENLRTFKEIY